jgi:chaperonin GroEL
MKRIFFDEEALGKIAEGADAISKAVTVTLGPNGRNVALEKVVGSPLITKDGVSVAREATFGDIRKIGADIFRQSSLRTSEVAGDGTTTSMELTHAMFNGLKKNLSAGSHPVFLSKGMKKGLEHALGFLDSFSAPISSFEEIEKVASLSANGDTALGSLIAEAVELVGKDGIITVEEGQGLETTLEFSEGMQLDRGYSNRGFIVDPSSTEIRLKNPLVLLADKRISDIHELIPALESAYREKRPLLVIAHDVEGQALQTCLTNHAQRRLDVCVVRAPRIGEKRSQILENLATLSGGLVISDATQTSLKTTPVDEVLGGVDSVLVTHETTTLVGWHGVEKDILLKIREMETKLQTSGSEHDKEFYQQQMSQMGGGLAIIRVGAFTELALKEYKARIEDALSATQSSIKEGIVAGGGSTLVQISDYLEYLMDEGEVSFENEDERVGYVVVYQALKAPFFRILHNAGIEPQRALIKLTDAFIDDPTSVFDLKTETVLPALEAGVVDPTLVVKEVLRNSVSVSSSLAMTKALIVNKSTL